MTDPTITDLRRELEKALEALQGCLLHLTSHAEMNAALHCSQRVMYSPLHAKTEAALTGASLALQRAAAAPVPSDTDPRWARLLWDLDRCVHGRHSADQCGSCGHMSSGNPHLEPGDVIGYGLYGDRIVIPTPAEKHDPAKWRQPTENATRTA